MEFKNIKYKKQGAIAKITLNRPEALNSLSFELISEMEVAVADLQKDASIRVLVITGEGRAFAAGANIPDFQGLSAHDAWIFCKRLHGLLRSLEEMPKPVIAMINGLALGGGCELSMACDIRVASMKARFSQPEINLGLIPGAGGTQRLPRLVGRGRAIMLVLTGDMISAEEAERIGLVDMLVPPDELEAKVMELAGKIASKSMPVVAIAKDAIVRGSEADLVTGLSYEANSFASCFATEDHVEGVKAFMEKRKPEFKDR